MYVSALSVHILVNTIITGRNNGPNNENVILTLTYQTYLNVFSLHVDKTTTELCIIAKDIFLEAHICL